MPLPPPHKRTHFPTVSNQFSSLSTFQPLGSLTNCTRKHRQHSHQVYPDARLHPLTEPFCSPFFLVHSTVHPTIVELVRENAKQRCPEHEQHPIPNPPPPTTHFREHVDYLREGGEAGRDDGKDPC